MVEEVKASSFSPEGMGIVCYPGKCLMTYVIVEIEKRGGEHIVDVRDQSVQRFQDQYVNITRYENITYLGDGYWRELKTRKNSRFLKAAPQ